MGPRRAAANSGAPLVHPKKHQGEAGVDFVGECVWTIFVVVHAVEQSV